jgi:hypothetical protein
MGMTADADALHRTLKLELDSGRARSEDEARRIASQYILQIAAGADIAARPTRQAALLTAVNAGCRAFLGGVRVRLEEDFVFSTAWQHGKKASEVLPTFAGVRMDELLDDERPTVVIGTPAMTPSMPLYVTWEGWAGGIVIALADRLGETEEMTLAGVLGGALAVSEAFQWARGYSVAANRPVGVSLWRPELDWRSAEAHGPALTYLPSNLWLLGLGHLGQAYAWCLGFLPYGQRSAVTVMLQDVDAVVEANASTSMLVTGRERAEKTRVVDARLRQLGFDTRMTERLFDEHQRRQEDEPRIALAGFHSPAPRRLLEDPRFDIVVDGGLGATAEDYLGINIYRFPSQNRASNIFSDRPAQSGEGLLEQPVYQTAVAAGVADNPGASEEAVRCGILEIAGKSVGAAFVGCVAATLCLGEVLRVLAGGDSYAVIDISLKTVHHLKAAVNENSGPFVNPGYVVAVPLAPPSP